MTNLDCISMDLLFCLRIIGFKDIPSNMLELLKNNY